MSLFRAKLLSLGIGFLCIVAAYHGLAAITPSLRLSLAVEDDKFLLRFSNSGRKPIRLDTNGMEYFVLYPANDSHNYVVMVRERPFISMQERAARETSLTVVRPGEHVDIANIYPMLRGLPSGQGKIEAVYTAFAPSDLSGIWRGTVRSIGIPLEVE